MATIKVKQVKSSIGAPKDQKDTLRSLRLTKMNRVAEHEDTPSLRGRIRKVHHLVKIVD
ncbi:MAG TPA: 50S ribosomal protein L30 [Candidatus Avibacteroides avistercoris]|uniref:Large ribosomal subunit protein uL30 n=1 Tax=Candidatus Avibacteroides avistercoris TaxID=2840690 RepID=A0A9D2ZV04_9BACT|nr:50S ribosomal protein L30 [Candidatus Avibacteroides avistercoris]